MATSNFAFKSIKIENYRGIDSLKIDKLTRINIIGGKNGSGKSTLLDAIFLVLDRKNAIALNRPYITKGMQVPYPNGFDYIFNNNNTKRAINIEFDTTEGHIKSTFEKSDKNPSIQKTHNQANQKESLIFSLHDNNLNNNSIKITTHLSSRKIDDIIVTQSSPSEINLTYTPAPGANSSKNIPAAFIEHSGNMSQVEMSERISTIIRNGEKATLIKSLNIINPTVNDIEIFVDAGTPVAYVTCADNQKRPATMLGGGFSLLLSTVLLFTATKNGILLLDEIESSIHHSKLEEYWLIICTLAKENNCQVFAVTHSKELIKAAAACMYKNDNSKDLSYIRIEVCNGKTIPVSYSHEEVFDAIESEWEIR